MADYVSISPVTPHWRNFFEDGTRFDLLKDRAAQHAEFAKLPGDAAVHAAEFDRFLADSTVRFCLDTGHLFIGGADPVAIARNHSDRVGLVHIKDVNASVAARMRAGEFDLMAATAAGLFPSAGKGDVPIAQVIEAMDAAAFAGWFVLEQDVALTSGEPPIGEGPMVGVRVSLDHLRSLDAPVAAS